MTVHAALATAPIIPPERLPPLAEGAPDISAIEQAAERIRGEAVLTPLLEVLWMTVIPSGSFDSTSATWNTFPLRVK